MAAVTDTGPTTTLVWVRHGEAANNRDRHIGGWSPLPLTPLGHAQAAAAGAALAATRFDAIWTSDLARASETAAAIARHQTAPLQAEPGLRERSLGVLDGLPFAEAEALAPMLFARRFSAEHDQLPERGESLATVYARVAEVVDRAVRSHAGGHVLLVSHGIALYHAFCHVVGLGVPGVDHQVFSLVGNASISEVTHRIDSDGRARWQLLRWNDNSHLAAVTGEHTT